MIAAGRAGPGPGAAGIIVTVTPAHAAPVTDRNAGGEAGPGAARAAASPPESRTAALGGRPGCPLTSSVTANRLLSGMFNLASPSPPDRLGPGRGPGSSPEPASGRAAAGLGSQAESPSQCQAGPGLGA
jgi:hypothetical protein